MIRRFYYHLFWNFYDYLGSYLLLGSCSALLILSTIAGPLSIDVIRARPLLFLFTGCCVVMVLYLASAWFMAGLFHFATRAANGEPARLPNFMEGTRLHFAAYLKLLASWFVLAAIAVSNIWFYLQIAPKVESGGVRMVLIALSMIFLWALIGIKLFMSAALSVPPRFPGETKLLSMFRRAMILLAVAPSLWIVAALTFTVLSAVCIVSVAGVVFLFPLIAVMCTTSASIVGRLVEDLGQARKDLGDGKALSKYKSRALELGWEWEHRQPRRTLRELIRPWEN